MKSLNSKTNTLPTLVSGTSAATSNQDKANLLNATFVNNFHYSPPGLNGLTGELPDPAPPLGCPFDFLCTEDEVYDLLSTLDTTKASGHDNISARMRRETAMSVTPAVTNLFNKAWRIA